MKKIISLCALFFTLATTGFSAESKKLTVLLDWFANPNHAPLFVAEQQGYFKAQGLNVELIGPADPSDPPKLVAAGKADIAITYQPDFMEQVDRGLPLIRIGTLIDRPLACLVVLQSSSIKTISDLEDKQIGYSGDNSSVILKVMLEKNHLTEKDVHLINVRYDLTQALLSKKVDAVTGMMRNVELLQLKLLRAPGRAFYPEDNGVPSYSELIFVVNKSHVNDPRYKAFLIALKQGVDYLKIHPETAWMDFTKTHPAADDEFNKLSWISTVPYFANDPAKFDKTSWLKFANFLAQNGLVSKPQPITLYAVDLTASSSKH
jgi:putative hydroxymethylpyrimidine transport system substrate-binding protein